MVSLFYGYYRVKALALYQENRLIWLLLVSAARVLIANFVKLL